MTATTESTHWIPTIDCNLTRERKYVYLYTERFPDEIAILGCVPRQQTQRRQGHTETKLDAWNAFPRSGSLVADAEDVRTLVGIVAKDNARAQQCR